MSLGAPRAAFAQARGDEKLPTGQFLGFDFYRKHRRHIVWFQTLLGFGFVNTRVCAFTSLTSQHIFFVAYRDFNAFARFLTDGAFRPAHPLSGSYELIKF